MDAEASTASARDQYATEIICLTLAWDQIPESISLEGGSDRILREPVIAILVRTSVGWVLLDTGTDARRFRGDNPERDLYARLDCQNFRPKAIRFSMPSRRTASPPPTSPSPPSRTSTSITRAAFATSPQPGSRCASNERNSHSR